MLIIIEKKQNRQNNSLIRNTKFYYLKNFNLKGNKLQFLKFVKKENYILSTTVAKIAFSNEYYIFLFNINSLNTKSNKKYIYDYRFIKEFSEESYKVILKNNKEN